MDIKQIYDRARVFAIKNRYWEFAEDFATHVSIYCLEKPDIDPDKIFLRRRLIDFLRLEFGDSRKSARFEARFKTVEIEPHHAVLEPSNEICVEEIDAVLDYLPIYERLLYVAYHKHAISQTTLADCLGLNPARISQIIKRIQSRIDKTVAQRERRISCPRKTALEILLRKKRQRLECAEDGRVPPEKSFRVAGFNEKSF